MPGKPRKRRGERKLPKILDVLDKTDSESESERSPKLKMPEINLQEAPPAVEKIRQAQTTTEPPDMSDLTLADSSRSQHHDRTEVEKHSDGPKKRQNDVTVNALTPSIPPSKMCQSNFAAEEPLDASCLTLKSPPCESDSDSPDMSAADDVWAMLNNSEAANNLTSSESQSEIVSQPTITTPSRPTVERSKQIRRPLFSEPRKTRKPHKPGKVINALGSGDEEPDERDEYEMTPWRHAREDLRHRKGKRIPAWATGDKLLQGMFAQREYLQEDTSMIFPTCPTNWVPFPDKLNSPIRDCPTGPTPPKPEDKGYNIAVYVIRVDRSN